jgi:hypothetical protein
VFEQDQQGWSPNNAQLPRLPPSLTAWAGDAIQNVTAQFAKMRIYDRSI